MFYGNCDLDAMANCYDPAKQVIAIPRQMANMTVKGKRFNDDDVKKMSS